LPPLLATRALAARLHTTLRIARVFIENGRGVDLDGLDRETGLVCARTLDLPPDEGRTLRPVLVQLLEETDRLSRALPTVH
jgi:hypothetical protein